MTATLTNPPRRATSQNAPDSQARATSDKLPFLVVLYLLCVILPVSMNVGGVYLTTLRVLLLLVTLPMLVSLLIGRYGKTIPTDWLFLAHAVWLTLALAVNNPDRVIQQAPSVGVEFLGGYVLARTTIRTRTQFIAMCKWLVALVLCLLPFALLETQTGDPLILRAIRALPGVTSVDITRDDPRLGMARVQTTFAHPIHFGLFCSIAFSLAFVGLHNVYGNTRRFISAALVALAGFTALSSGALLAIALQVALIGWAFTFRKTEKRWWLLIGLFVLMWVAIDIVSNRGPFQVFMSYATFSAHNAYWRSIIFEWGIMNIFGSVENNVPASPWFGIGLNDWARPDYMFSGSMDNFWLVMGVRYGFPGFLLIALGFVMQVKSLMQLKLPHGHPSLFIRRACVFTFLGLSFTLATVHVWGNVYSFVMFFVGATGWMVQTSAMDDAGGGVPLPATSERKGANYSRFAPRTGPAARPYARQPR
ncbi:O-antigen ligase [Jannaschia faecimaris]|uniref:O-antigen ligase n=1 Tax=Jannaschia faecimaris TaxID=1244108 RepID=A0A1H3J2G5_9RHOB|nr:O-antigen ligase family protein [Jannaschia faecimaris]SDY33374.1 O-antigen ligase [Jannaschia faecimaris]